MGMNTTAKDTARDTVHHTTTKDTVRDTLHVTTEDTFHTAHQPTIQEESSAVELVVTEEDTTRDVTLQSSITAKLYKWIVRSRKKKKNIFFLMIFFISCC